MNVNPPYEFKINTFEQFVKMWHAGNATFFLKNSKSNSEFSIKFHQVNRRRKSAYRFISLAFTLTNIADLTGNKQRMFHEVGYILVSNGHLFLKNHTTLTKNIFDYYINCFLWVNKCVETGSGFPNEVSVWYDGHCARCGKELNNTESIDLGFGTECIEYQKVTNPGFQLKTGL